MLTTQQFETFFQSIHGYKPFPWQQRLLEQVVREERWPRTLVLPTGTGKTSILDVSVFALACGIRTPRRTVLVVDRRIVVDDAFRRAEKIRDALQQPEAPTVLRDVRDALLRHGGTSPLEVALLRGGIYREDNWAKDPLQPVVVCSTVDQVGSRLLYQGYGVSASSRPIHAGLLANDALIILDEAHTSEPFRQTLEWIEKYRNIAEEPLELPFGIVSMTATPRETETPFELGEDDWENPVLRQRLHAQKRLSLITSEKEKDAGLERQIIQEVEERLQPGRTILVVVNRVKTARAIAEELEKKSRQRKDPLNIECPILLTGRSRPLEREHLLEPHRDANANRLFSGRDRSLFAEDKPLIVVATQCVEVGADLDVDVLISEVCPLDSLKQRIGRLDRLGELGTSEVVLVAPSDIIEKEEWEDPVYGTTPREVWQWLGERSKNESEIDVGISGWRTLLEDMDGEQLRSMVPTTLDAPVMFPAYLDLLVQTSPAPTVLPDPALFLHGPQRGIPEVQIVWRSDLDVENTDVWVETIAECPPVVGEALRVPLYQAKRWLERDDKNANGGSDLEGEREDREKAGKPREDESRCFLKWQGQDSTAPSRSAADLRPGDTIVLASSEGGCDKWGWNPQHTDSVSDLADEALFRSRRAPVLRLATQMPPALSQVFSSLPMEQTDETLPAIEEQVCQLLRSLEPESLEEEHYQAAIAALKKNVVASSKKGIEVLPHPQGMGWIIRGRQRMSGQLRELIDDDDGASRLGRAVTLVAHSESVEKEVASFAQQLRLSQDVAGSLQLAASLHDVGKADPRFQTMLHGGNRFKVSPANLLAKSARMPISKIEADEVRRRSAYPKGARHELLSVRLAEDMLSQDARTPAEVDLVLHLIASHHGRCRPFAPVVKDPQPRTVSLQWREHTIAAMSDTMKNQMTLAHVASGVTERFWRLNRRYGWWGLSCLEACLRLADWKASAKEDKGGAS